MTFNMRKKQILVVFLFLTIVFCKVNKFDSICTRIR